MTGTRNQITLLVPNVALDRDGRIIIPASRHARRSDPVDRLGTANSLFDPSGKLLVHAGKLAKALRPQQPRHDRRQKRRTDDGKDRAEERKRGGLGKRVAVRVNLGGRGRMKKKNTNSK